MNECHCGCHPITLKLQDVAVIYSKDPPPTPPKPEPEVYGGPYEVTPGQEEVVLQTNGKLMEDDVTIHAAPGIDPDDPEIKYFGEYDYTPSLEGGTLSTANKYLKEDIKIDPIPYARVANVSGGDTVTIGG